MEVSDTERRPLPCQDPNEAGTRKGRLTCVEMSGFEPSTSAVRRPYSGVSGPGRTGVMGPLTWPAMLVPSGSWRFEGFLSALRDKCGTLPVACWGASTSRRHGRSMDAGELRGLSIWSTPKLRSRTSSWGQIQRSQGSRRTPSEPSSEESGSAGLDKSDRKRLNFQLDLDPLTHE